MNRLAACAILTLALCAPAVKAASATPDVRYTVKQGDNLYQLAADYFQRPGDWVALRNRNKVREPRRLPVGSILRIPRALLREDPSRAIIERFSGSVNVVRNGRQSVPASIGLAVAEGDQIETSADAFVTLRLDDGTALTMPSQSKIVVTRLRVTRLTNSVTRAFGIQGGRVRSIVVPMHDPYSSFRVTTPVTTSSVRGTEFSVAYDAEAKRAATAVTEGVVAVDTSDSRLGLKAKQVTVERGFGVVEATGALSAPLPLLAPPTLFEADRAQDEADLHFTLAPTTDATAYRIQIARDAGALDVFQEKLGTAPTMTMDAPADGTYFARISAIDALGLEGQPATYSFDRTRHSIRASVTSTGSARHKEYIFRWETGGNGTYQFRLQIAQDTVFSTPIVDEPGLTGHSLTITALPPGEYYWRVLSLQTINGKTFSRWTAPATIHISKGR